MNTNVSKIKKINNNLGSKKRLSTSPISKTCVLTCCRIYENGNIIRTWIEEEYVDKITNFEIQNLAVL